MTMTGNLSSSIKIAGIGGAGINMISRLVEEPLPNGTEVIAIDADRGALSSMPVKNGILLGVIPFKRGLCSLNPSELMSAYDASLDTIREAFREAGYVILVAGLGGVTGSTVTPLVATLLKELDIPSLGIFTTPFPIEGKKRSATSEETIHALRLSLNTFFVFPNRDIAKVAGGNISFKDAYVSLNDFMSHIVWCILRAFPYPQTCRSFDFVRMMMSGAGGAGCIGIGKGNGENRALDALNDAIQFIGEERYKKASRIALILEGDNDLRINQIGEAFDHFRNMADQGSELCSELIINDSAERKSLVIILAAGFWNKH
jgi:cell division protein FtsZ